MIEPIVRDPALFETLFDEIPLTVDPTLPLRDLYVAYTSTERLTEAVTEVLATDANLRTWDPCRDGSSSVCLRLSSSIACFYRPEASAGLHRW